jgi:hypothetical protein
MNYLLTPVILFVLLACRAQAGEVEYKTITRVTPRSLSIHMVRIDLADPDRELAVVAGPDPDGDGPAESQLIDPRKLAASGHLFIAVNANPWKNLAPKPGDPVPEAFMTGTACNIAGWALAEGKQKSGPQQFYRSFWLDPEGRGHIGDPASPVPARLALAGFSQILREGNVLPSEGGDLHPRTALGLDKEGCILTLVTVDGRQKGFSEGMSESELAGLMKELGCTDALNLDGGGSTVFLRWGQILNSPSHGPKSPGQAAQPRPVPVMIGLRNRGS